MLSGAPNDVRKRHSSLLIFFKSIIFVLTKFLHAHFMSLSSKVNIIRITSIIVIIVGKLIRSLLVMRDVMGDQDKD
jgi:hypothetical protein